MDCYPPSRRAKLRVTITHNHPTRRKIVTLDKMSRSRIKNWNAAACVYVIVRNLTIQYVGCSSTNFFKRFTAGLGQAHAQGYRWPTTDGHYQLFIWKINKPRYFVEAVEAEVALLHRAVLGDWPIELSQLSPKRHLVHPEASAFGKRLAFGIYIWLASKEHIVFAKDDLVFIEELWKRSIVC